MYGNGMVTSVLMRTEQKNVTVSCAQYGDAKFFFMLNFYTKAENPTAMYWKMDKATFAR